MAHGRSKKAEAQKGGPERAQGRPTREGEGPGGGKGPRRAGWLLDCCIDFVAAGKQNDVESRTCWYIGVC